MATIVEKQSTKQTFLNKSYSKGMGTTTEKLKRRGGLNLTKHQPYMADSCLYTKAGRIVKIHMLLNNQGKVHLSGMLR